MVELGKRGLIHINHIRVTAEIKVLYSIITPVFFLIR